MNIQKFTIQGELTDLNTYIRVSRGNKYASNALKRSETERCVWEIKKAKIGPVKERVVISYDWYCKDKRKDIDNISFAKKFINDALVESGVLKNDGWGEIATWAEGFWIDKENPRVEIRLFKAKEEG